jgi:tetratricopeptide (TPR) repeat protein
MNRRLTGIATAIFALSLASLTARAVDPGIEQLVEDSHWKRAKAALEPYVQKNPNDARALYLLSNVRGAYREFKEGLALAERAAALDPKSGDYRGQVAEMACELADVEKSFGWARRCKKELQAAADLDLKNIGVRRGLMEFNMQAPWIVGGSKSDARRILEDIKRINASQGALAQIRMNQLEKKNDPAEPLLLQAYQADPANYAAVIGLAQLYLNKDTRKLELSEKYAREAMKLKPSRTGPYTLLAVNYVVQTRWADAEAMLAQSEKAIPDNFWPYFQAGRVATGEAKDLQRAEQYLRKFLTIEPEPGSATHADAHYWLGITYDKMSRKSDAIREMEEALRLNPKHEPAKRDLKRLRP